MNFEHRLLKQKYESRLAHYPILHCLTLPMLHETVFGLYLAKLYGSQLIQVLIHSFNNGSTVLCWDLTSS